MLWGYSVFSPFFFPLHLIFVTCISVKFLLFICTFEYKHTQKLTVLKAHEVCTVFKTRKLDEERKNKIQVWQYLYFNDNIYDCS